MEMIKRRSITDVKIDTIPEADEDESKRVERNSIDVTIPNRRMSQPEVPSLLLDSSLNLPENQPTSLPSTPENRSRIDNTPLRIRMTKFNLSKSVIENPVKKITTKNSSRSADESIKEYANPGLGHHNIQLKYNSVIPFLKCCFLEDKSLLICAIDYFASLISQDVISNVETRGDVALIDLIIDIITAGLITKICIPDENVLKVNDIGENHYILISKITSFTMQCLTENVTINNLSFHSLFILLFDTYYTINTLVYIILFRLMIKDQE